MPFLLTINQPVWSQLPGDTSLLKKTRVENKQHTVSLAALTGYKQENLNAPAKASDNFDSPDGTIVSGLVQVPIDSPDPFLAVTASWPSSGTAESPINIQLSSTENGADWGDWIKDTVDDDISDKSTSFMGELLFFDKETKFIRYRITVSDEYVNSTDIPDSLDLTFISPGATPEDTIRSFIAMYGSAGKKAAWWVKPPVVSRTSWGCPDGQDSRWTPAYTTVTHLVVHHTAGSNYSSDWPAVVRSIWSYHTLTQGWGDIGYNYLIDPTGVIYEGRAGGENAIGAHFSGHNSGTMGVSIMGTYITVSPATAALDNLTEILSWKCSESYIDPLGISYHASSQLTLHNICGHRDGGNTECPGQYLYDLLPVIRQEVALEAPLASPNLVSPGYNSYNQHIPIEFVWDEVNGATGYRLYVSNSLTGWNYLDGFDINSIVYDSGTLSNSSTTHLWNPDDSEDFEPVQLFYWTVQSENEYGTGFAASPYKFITGLTVPETSETELMIVNDNTVITFSWDEVDRAKYYRIMVSTSEDNFSPETGFPDPVLEEDVQTLTYEWDTVDEGTEYFWSVKAWHTSGFESRFSDVRSFTVQNGYVGIDTKQPVSFSLGNNHPNPFNPTTNIDFSLSHDSNVTLTVYNTAGQLVATLVNNRLFSGNHTVVWNAAGIPSGTYFYKLSADDKIDAKKMMLIK